MLKHNLRAGANIRQAGKFFMNQSRIAESAPEPATAATRSEVPGEEKQPASGMEVNPGDFTRTGGLMKSLRLVLNNQIVIPLEDIAGGLSDAGRKFKMGDIEQANLDVTRLYAAFGQKTSQWESRARSLEQQMRTQAVKNPKSISIDKMSRMKSEQTAVRTRISTAEVHFRRLQQGLEQTYTNLKSTNLKKQSAPAASQSPSDCPPKFLAAFQAASLADRPALVRQWFESVTPVQVNVTRGKIAGYDIQFDPLPPPGSLLFLTESAQIVQLQQLGEVTVIQDLETGNQSELRLVDFVKRIRSGAWLLGSSLPQPASAGLRPL